MRLYNGVWLSCVLLICGSCSRPTGTESDSASLATPQAKSAATPLLNTAIAPAGITLDACTLLTSRELQSVQGEVFKEAKPSARTDGGFSVSQCLFAMPTPGNSISLLVAQKGDTAGAIEPREFWQETFHRTQDGDAGKEQGRERDKASAKVAAEQQKTQVNEKAEGKPVAHQMVPSVGDEAFWTGNRMGGALYVLKGDTYLRISVGGPGDQLAKIRKASTLAQFALKHL